MLVQILKHSYKSLKNPPKITPTSSTLTIHTHPSPPSSSSSTAPTLQFSIHHYFQISDRSSMLFDGRLKNLVILDFGDWQSNNTGKKEEEDGRMQLGFEEVKKMIKWDRNKNNQLILTKSPSKRLTIKQQPTPNNQPQPQKPPSLQLTLSTSQPQSPSPTHHKTTLNQTNHHLLTKILINSIHLLTGLQNFYDQELETMIAKFQQMRDFQEKEGDSQFLLEGFGEDYIEEEIQRGRYIL